jgi:hypothetical protein
MRAARIAGALAAALLATAAVPAEAQQRNFNRVAAFPVPANLPQGTDPKTETSAEIIAASGDGMTLVYTDSPNEAVGFVDIADPRAPRALGSLKMEGEPTSVATLGGRAFVAVNTSESFTSPSGHLAVVDIARRTATRSCDLRGQPDSTAVAPDGSFLAVAIENERDEDLDRGRIPQLPGGGVMLIPLREGAPDCERARFVDLAGLAAVAPTDPEPEFVAINGLGEVVVTLQENNHIAIVDGRTGEVKAHFSAGAVDLQGIDARRDGRLDFSGSKQGALREPDAAKWLDDTRFVVANEGDYEGGARGFTIFSKTGEVLFESGASMELEIARIGHYPDHRSHSKGVEPEGLEVARFGDQTYIFVLAERSSIVAVYRDTGGAPELVGLLPSGVSPEGAVAIPSRGLLATANEVDLVEDGLARSHVMIFELQDAPAAYPTIVSDATENGRPVGFGALSGLAPDPQTPGRLYAVNDSVYGMQPTIFTIDATQTPARITAALRITRGGMPAQKLDLEGVVPDGSGGFWVASEGRTDRLIPHALYRISDRGEIRTEVAFPEALLASEIRFGAEGITKVGDVLWVAIQREWKDDPAGQVKLLAYDTRTREWGAVRYPLEPKGAGWMGLSDIAVHGDHVYIVERDNLIGGEAVVKRLYRVPLAQMRPAPLGGELPVVTKELVRDFMPDLARWNGYVVDKIEGFTVDAAGVGYVVTDNDGVDDSSGETFFWSIGRM